MPAARFVSSRAAQLPGEGPRNRSADQLAPPQRRSHGQRDPGASKRAKQLWGPSPSARPPKRFGAQEAARLGMTVSSRWLIRSHGFPSLTFASITVRFR
jgi:hypothetical protein